MRSNRGFGPERSPCGRLRETPVHDDTAIEGRYGSRGMDWFFAQLSGSTKDPVKDQTSGEVITGLRARPRDRACRQEMQ